MRLLFAGTPEVATAVAGGAPRTRRHEVVGVLTRPDAPAGRAAPEPSPVKAAADEAGIPVLTPRTLRDPEVVEATRGLGAGLRRGRRLRRAPAAGRWTSPGTAGSTCTSRCCRPGAARRPCSTRSCTATRSPVRRRSGSTAGLDDGPGARHADRGDPPARHRGRPARPAGRGRRRPARRDARRDRGRRARRRPATSRRASASRRGSRRTTARVRWDHPALAVDRRVRACTPAPGAWTTTARTAAGSSSARSACVPTRCCCPGSCGGPARGARRDGHARRRARRRGAGGQAADAGGRLGARRTPGSRHARMGGR